ncbi:MAG: hypothetical protein QM757_41155 [Paludibaculum sp.]
MSSGVRLGGCPVSSRGSRSLLMSRLPASRIHLVGLADLGLQQRRHDAPGLRPPVNRVAQTRTAPGATWSFPSASRLTGGYLRVKVTSLDHSPSMSVR